MAASFVRDRLRHRPRGRVRLASELQAKGVDPGTARRVVDQVLEDEEVTEEALAERVVRSWISRQSGEALHHLGATERSLAREKARRRLYGHLARRGFRGTALTLAMEMAVELARKQAGTS